MEFIEIIQNKINNLSSGFSLKEKRLFVEELSERYRKRESKLFIQNEGHRLAYLLTRFPATFAVLESVVDELKKRLPDLTISSYADWGCGPGLSLGILKAAFPMMDAVSFVEKDSGWMSFGKPLLKELFQEVKQNWYPVDFTNSLDTSPDLSLFSYSLGELPIKQAVQVAERAWMRTNKILVIIEPGTPVGFSYIKELRSTFIKQGAFIVAPCAHQNSCPMAQEKGEWCHFSKRLNRSSEHRMLKSAELGYEDEKYAYLIVSKEPAAAYQGRLVHSIQKRPGHMIMELCTEKGIEKKVVTKSQPLYRQVRKMEWGDAL